MTEEENMVRQSDREKLAVVRAIEKLRNEVESDPRHSPVGRRLVRDNFTALSKAISEEQARVRSRRLGKRGYLILSLSSDVLAVITLGGILKKLGGVERMDTVVEDGDDDLDEGEEGDEGKENFTALARDIGFHCQLQWFRTPPLAKKKAIERIAERAKTPDALRLARQRAEKALERDWTQSERDFQLGDALIKCAVDVKIVNVSRSINKNGKEIGPRLVTFTAKTRAALGWGAHLIALAQPFHRPMVCRPNPWLMLEGGGYLCNEAEKKLHLVKHWNNPKIKEGLKQGDYVVTRAAVNALQDTSWRVNRQLHDCMLKLQEPGSKLKVPREMRENLGFKLAVCGGLVNEERFYFPYQLDFRGRAYCLPPLVNPQADDIGRSLLEFAEGFPLGERGVFWLEVHLANAYGETKGCFDERRAWTKKNSKKIIACAGSPYEKKWWMKADKPWRFLAACFVWRDYCEAGLNVVSYLPITIDGTCNGFQHMSALLLNTKAAVSTNLASDDQPHDFYGEVADLLRSHLKSEAASGNVAAKDWIENVHPIDRKLVKPAVMKTPYGIGQAKIKKDLLEERFAKKLKEPEASCGYLAKIIKQCIEEAFPEGARLTKWLGNIAVKFGEIPTPPGPQGMQWTAPSDFRVVHEEWRGAERRIKSSYGTAVIYNPEKPEFLRKDKLIKGIVPNFIHSLDAAHLALTVSRLNREASLRGEIVYVGAIHDGFSVHAHVVDPLTVLLRQEFVSIYRKSPLKRLAFELGLQAIPVILDDPPESTDPPFEIERVLDSKYFFC